MKRLTPLLTLLVTFALTVGPAFAQSDVEGYGGPGGQVESAVGNETTGGGAGDALPFTGLELGILLAIALGLALVGYTLRKLTHDSAHEQG